MKLMCDITDTATLTRQEVLDAVGLQVQSGDLVTVSTTPFGSVVVKIVRARTGTEMPARTGRTLDSAELRRA